MSKGKRLTTLTNSPPKLDSPPTRPSVQWPRMQFISTKAPESTRVRSLGKLAGAKGLRRGQETHTAVTHLRSESVYFSLPDNSLGNPAPLGCSQPPGSQNAQTN